MSSRQYLREFVSERLTAAAEEIFGVFENIIVEYEEELGRQRKLLDVVLKPDIKLHRIELPQQHVCKQEEEEEAVLNPQLCQQKSVSGAEEEEPELPQIKEEGEDPLVVEQEIHTRMLTPSCGENLYTEPAPDANHRLRSHSSPVAEGQQRKGGKHQGGGACTSPPSATRSLKCDTCGKAFKYKSKLNLHLRSHTGEKPYACSTCGRCFSQMSLLKSHMRIHTGERPYVCATCGKAFRCSSGLLVHTRTHTGEKPYSCTLCGIAYRCRSLLKRHARTHTDEKPHMCKACGKCFGSGSQLKWHMRSHAGEKPHPCDACGRRFAQRKSLNAHLKLHAGEKPHPCSDCGKRFSRIPDLEKHLRIHTSSSLVAT